jgi:hypothetical protein
LSIAEKSLNEFVNLVRDSIRLFSFIELFWNTFDTLPQMKGYENGKTFLPKKDDIILEGVTY